MAANDHTTPEDRMGLPSYLDWMTLGGLGKCRDGLVDRMFTHAVQAVAADLDAAPDIKTARKITITIEAKPMGMDDHGNLQGVTAACQVKTAVPARQASMALEVRRPDINGRSGPRSLAMNRHSADNPNQTGFDFQDPDE